MPRRDTAVAWALAAPQMQRLSTSITFVYCSAVSLARPRLPRRYAGYEISGVRTMAIAPAASLQPVARTLSLIEVCECELARLRETRADYRNSIEASRKLIAGCRNVHGEDHCHLLSAPMPLAPFQRPSSQFCIERAKETSTFAEKVYDLLVKRLLPEIAGGYDQARFAAKPRIRGARAAPAAFRDTSASRCFGIPLLTFLDGQCGYGPSLDATPVKANVQR
jgi:hypothetical protein